MSITLELSPELHARLAREAQARGMALETYLRTLIEEVSGPRPALALDLDEFQAVLDTLAERSANLPPISSEHFRRERIYQGHD